MLQTSNRARLFAVGLIPTLSLLMGLIALLSLPVPAANADPITLVANLTEALEFPPTGSPGTGQATVLLDTSLNTMEVKVTFSGLKAGTTASHIHCCLSSPLQRWE